MLEIERLVARTDGKRSFAVNGLETGDSRCSVSVLPVLHMSDVCWAVAVPDDVIALSSSGVAILRCLHQPRLSLTPFVTLLSKIMMLHLEMTQIAKNHWQALAEVSLTH